MQELIFIGGVSSSGKSSIAKLLQSNLKNSIIIAIDDIPIWNYSGRKYWGEWINEQMANIITTKKEKYIIIDAIYVVDIINKLKNKYKIHKILLYASPQKLYKNVLKRQKKDKRMLNRVYKHFSNMYKITNVTTKVIDEINVSEFKNNLLKMKHEFYNLDDLNETLATIYKNIGAQNGVVKITSKDSFDCIINTDKLTLNQSIVKVLNCLIGSRS